MAVIVLAAVAAWFMFSGSGEQAVPGPNAAVTGSTQPATKQKQGEKPAPPDRTAAKPEEEKAGTPEKPVSKVADSDPFRLGTIDPDSPAAGYLEAFKLLDLPKDSEEWKKLNELVDKILKEGWNGEHPELERLLAANREALSKLKDAIDAGGYFPVPEDATISMNINYIMPAREIARLLALEGMWFQKEGDIENAARNIADGVSFSQDVVRGGPIIADMIGIVIQRCFLDVAEQEFSRPSPNTRFCSALERSFYDLEYSHGVAGESLKTEEMLMRNYFEQYLDSDMELREQDLKALELTREDATPEAARNTLELFRQWTAQLSSSLEQGYYPAIKKAEVIAGKIASKDPDIPKLVHLITPSYVNILKTKAHAKVRFEMARTGIALQNYAAATGNYPESLDSLVPKYIPQVPVDPFSGTSINYAKSETGWTLRSFGPDMDDDGGARKAEKASDDGDLILQKE